MIDMTKAVPTPETYEEYVRQRNERTKKAMATMDKISGNYCKEHNLSVRLLFDNGYVFDATTDTMVKQ